jgi:hypothetical protein
MREAAETAPGDRVGAGSFGRWIVDGAGEPAFAFEPAGGLDRALVTPAGGTDECWHAVGNHGITATAHAGGWTTIYATSRGVVRLTGRQSTWGMADGTDEPVHARFDLNGAQWERDAGPFLVRRRISAPVDGAAVLRIDVTIERRSGTATDPAAPRPAYVERWHLDPLPLLVGALMSRYEPPPPGYGRRERMAWSGLYRLSDGVRRGTDAVRRVLARRLLRRPMFDRHRRAIVVVPRVPIGPVHDVPASPAWYDRALPWFFVALLDEREVETDLDAMALRVPLEPDARATGEAVTLTFAVGLARDDADLDRLLAHAGDADAYHPSSWSRLAAVSVPDAPPVEREATWHVAQLVTAQQHDDYFGHRYVAQGSAYGFIHGLQGAPRDYALFAVPLAYVDPVAARDQLQVMMRMARPSGSTYYAHTGRGQCTSGGLHAAPTDLPLFFLWALTDYVWTTGDHAFLDQPIPFWPAGGDAATPRERIAIAVRYLEERVGLGRHGLLRVGSGDWSDPISAMVGDRKAFHDHGESGFNSAFAAYALPRAAQLIEHDHPAEAARARDLAEALRAAMAEAWSGSWFLRGWDGAGGPIGDEHLFLDGQVWALIAGIGTDAQRRELVRAIAERNDDPSPIGATILDRPHEVRLGMLAPGWDCNGGVWATINALLAWGYAIHDPARAWRNLQEQSLAAHADAYPDIWYGIWSGPDAYNAHFGSRAGETFVQPATPMREFPVMNANAHAGPLLALLRVLGLETDASGIVVRDRGPAVPPWSLTTSLGTFASPSRRTDPSRCTHRSL